MANPNKLNRDGSVDGEVTNETIQLGQHKYEMEPQRIGYLRQQLGLLTKNLTELPDVAGAGIVGALGDKTYDALKVFIPDLMPRYEFAGYATQEAHDADDYNVEYDRSPTPPQVVGAFRAAVRLNKVDLLGHVGKLVDPRLLRGVVNKALAEAVEQQMLPSPNSSQDDTATPSTTSGTTPLMSELEVDAA